jgi:5-(aminomethyl)-3-furanmethanol phosphate kinase
MGIDAVLKIGGSLSRGAGLQTLCREISGLSKRHALLVVPGGGDFADQVRKVYRQYNLDETAAHHMALLAMDQYGYLLNRLIPDSFLTANLNAALDAAEKGNAAVLLPSAIVIATNPLPHSWQVTSDTIAACLASVSGCRRLVLIKDVDGLFAQASLTELIREVQVDQLSKLTGGVDAYLSKYLTGVSLETWIINGNHPDRLAELLKKNQTLGTRIKECCF